MAASHTTSGGAGRLHNPDRRLPRRRRSHPSVARLLESIKAGDKGQLSVSEEDGRFLRVLVATSNAKRALEIGAAQGYSAIWIGLALRETGGRLTTIEYDAARAATAAANIRRAGLSDIVTVVPGDAFKEIPKLAGTFDFVFLDAWKPDYQRFFDMVFPRLNAARPLPRPQRRQQTERDARFPGDDRAPPRARHVDRASRHRGDVGVGQAPMTPIHIIGVPLDLGGNRRGVDMGPSALRIAGLGDRLASLGVPVVDKGDLPSPIPETRERSDERKKFIGDIAHVCRMLYESARASLAEGALPLVLGGDHSLAAGSVSASAEWAKTTKQLPIGLLWIDAHGDMNTPATSQSGNVHGMPLAALLGPEPAELSGIGGPPPRVQPAQTVIIGVRNLDEREKVAVRDSRVHVFTMKDIDRQGIASIVEQAVGLAGQGTAGIHVSFDMDVCDPAIAPGVGTPVKGGLDYREAHMLMEIIADSGLLTALDLVEINPTLDVRNATAQLGTELVLSALGKKIL